MKQRSIDIFVVAALTIVALALALILPGNSVPSHIWTLPLVFLLPGYALTAAFPSGEAFDIPRRLVFILGISLVVVVIGGLILNLTPFGLSAASWAVYLSSITLGACIVAFLRRQRGGIAASSLSTGIIGFTFRQGLMLGLAALIVCGAFAVSIIGAQRQPTVGFTQLAIQPANGTASNAVSLEVSNMESTTMNYRLAISVNGKVVHAWSSIDLSPNQNWTATLVLPQSYTGNARVEADLYRANTPTKIYRHVILWLDS